VKVVLLENDERTIRDLCFCLEVRYPQVNCAVANSLENTHRTIKTEPPELIILDASFPSINILDLINEVRHYSEAPLIVLSEGGTDMDRAVYLEAGADDFIVKPFSPIELLARVRALMRRSTGLGFKPDHALSVGDLTINFNTHEVSLQGRPVKLTPTEFYLLSELVRNEGKVMTNDALVQKVWGTEYESDDSNVKRYIYRLRSKIESDASKPRMLLTERGIGYKFISPS
jgi:DNA-binding response OmpR family regulator